MRRLLRGYRLPKLKGRIIHQVTLDLPVYQIDYIAKKCAETGMTPSQFVNQSIKEYIRKQDLEKIASEVPVGRRPIATVTTREMSRHFGRFLDICSRSQRPVFIRNNRKENLVMLPIQRFTANRKSNRRFF